VLTCNNFYIEYVYLDKKYYSFVQGHYLFAIGNNLTCM